MVFGNYFRKGLWAAVALGAICLAASPASAGALCAVGTAGFDCAGTVVDFSTLGAISITNLGVNFVLADGLAVSFDVNESISGNLGAGATTSAYIKITNLVAQDIGLGAVNDNVYIFSDVFNPGVAGTAGVGATGYYGAIPAFGVAPVGGVYAASSQAQMNYLSVPAGLGGPPPFSLTTPPTIAIGNPAIPFRFWESARSPIGAGTVQLVGGLNFTMSSGSEIYMPGSLIVDDNAPAAFASEVPEPGTTALLGGGLVALAAIVRRRVRR